MISSLIKHPLLTSALFLAQACTAQAPKAPSSGGPKPGATGDQAPASGGSYDPTADSGGAGYQPPVSTAAGSSGGGAAYQPPVSIAAGSSGGSLAPTNGIAPVTPMPGINNQNTQKPPLTQVTVTPTGSQTSAGPAAAAPLATQTQAEAAAGKALIGSWTGASDVVAAGVTWSITTISSHGTGTGTGPGMSASPSGVKKGLGMWGTAGTAGSKVGASWYYNWKTAPNMGDSGKLEFVPMLWGQRDNNDNGYAQIKSAASPNVLGPNEPDRGGSDGSAMSPEDAIALWPKLIATGKRLGSPAVASDYNWLDRFMQQTQSKGYKVDFIAVHHYPNALDLNEVDAMRKTLTDLHQKYNKPLWYTEFGICSYATHGAMSEAQKQAFINKMIDMLEALDFVERYAWFSDRSFSSCEDSAIFSGGNNDLTATGNAYKAAGKSAAP